MDYDRPVSTRNRLENALTALVFGTSVTLPLYLWQQDTEVAIAAMVIAVYTAWLWLNTRSDIAANDTARNRLRSLPINRSIHRLRRMAAMVGFWWSLGFGSATVTGSVWYAGLHEPAVIASIGCVWAIVAASLNYGVTMLGPTTRCRRCNYELAAHLNPTDSNQIVQCPECGRLWTRAQMCLDISDAQPKQLIHRKAA